MVNFLAPAALAGLLLISIPVLIHIFRPKRVRKIPFSSLRWLRQTKQKFSRRIQWHQFLLFLVRVAFVILLVFALSRPLWDQESGEAASERWVLLDRGVAMTYQEPGEPMLWERAQGLVSDLLKQNTLGERTGVVAVGSRPYSLGSPRGDAERWSSAVEALTPSLAPANLETAFRLLGPQINQGSTDPVEILVYTANRASDWNSGAIRDLIEGSERPLQVKVLDLGPEVPANGWIQRAFPIENEAGEFVLRVELRAVGQDNMERTLQIDGIPGRERVEENIRLRVGETMNLDIPLPPNADWSGEVIRLSLLPEDSYAVDDHLSLVLAPLGSRSILVVDGDPSARMTDRSGHFLITALHSLRRTGRASWNIQYRELDQLTLDDLDDSGVVFLVNVPRLQPEQLESLRNRVREGAGLAIFSGSRMEPSFYNEQLYNPVQPEESLIPFQLGSVERIRPGSQRNISIEGVDWSHPLFRRLGDPQFSDFESTRFFGFHLPDSDLLPGARVLATAGGEAPAIVERTFGRGKILFFNFTANDAWSNLPRRMAFLPLIDQMVEELSVSGGRREFFAGETISWSVPEGVAVSSVSVIGPDGEQVAVRTERVEGRDVIRLPSDIGFGVYEVSWTEDGEIHREQLMLQRTVGDSQLVRQDPEILAAWFEGADFEYVSLSNQDFVPPVRDRFPLWPWLLALGGLFFLWEMYLVHRVCPAGNPNLASSLVEKGRILATKAEQSHPTTS